jgi:hypothetical protein
MIDHTDRDMPTREELATATARPMPRSFTVVGGGVGGLGVRRLMIWGENGGCWGGGGGAEETS